MRTQTGALFFAAPHLNDRAAHINGRLHVLCEGMKQANTGCQVKILVTGCGGTAQLRAAAAKAIAMFLLLQDGDRELQRLTIDAQEMTPEWRGRDRIIGCLMITQKTIIPHRTIEEDIILQAS